MTASATPYQKPYPKFNDWVLYQNLFFYLLLYHFQDTCVLIKTNPEKLSFKSLYETAKITCLTHSDKLLTEKDFSNHIKSFFSKKTAYQAFANAIFTPEKKEEKTVPPVPTIQETEHKKVAVNSTIAESITYQPKFGSRSHPTSN